MEITPASVLIIENHPMMREALRMAIADEPDLRVAEVVLDSSQTQAIGILDEVFFLPQDLDIILLALGNPGLVEMEALKALRKSLPNTPILALTSNEVDGQEQAALEAGAQAVLTKAVARHELIQTLRHLRLRKTVENPEFDSGRWMEK
jgi:two-component system, NarL family, nitrate/nitrite response regulator NarL